MATLVATRAAKPSSALVIATVGIFLGPFLLGSAVATTIAGLVEVDPSQMVEVVTAGLVAALVWNGLMWWRRLPSSSTHALVGGLVGAAIAAAGVDAVNWGGFNGWRPVGVLGTLVALAISPPLGALAGYLVLRLGRWALRRATLRFERPLRESQWLASGLLALGQGANDAQKSVGVIVAVLFANGTISSLNASFLTTLGAALAMAAGTAVGGWGIVRTIGRRIYRLRPLDSLASQSSSAAVIIASSVAGAPISGTHVVASSVVGVGAGARRWKRIRWTVVREIGVAWLTTIPATAALAAGALGLWRLVT
jgi:inorganic phosphate transporter, PiT family